MKHWHSAIRRLMVGLPLALLGWSCASTPVAWTVASDHPASPKAQEAATVPLPNLFADLVEEEPMDSMKHEQSEEMPGMDHSGMDHSGMDHSGMDHSGMGSEKPDAMEGHEGEASDPAGRHGHDQTEKPADPPPAGSEP